MSRCEVLGANFAPQPPPESYDLDPLSSQTKCNTHCGECCDGMQLRSTLARGAVFACRATPRRPFDPANCCSSGSPAVDDLAGAEAKQQRRAEGGTLSTGLRSGPGGGATMVRLAPGARRAPAREGARVAEPGLVARAGRRPAQARGRRSRRHRLRDHLPLHLCPAEAHQRRRLATLPPQGQVSTRPARQERRQPRPPHQAPRPHP